ncbi:MAG: BatA domain-containing protein, partial [Planctomycetota bacterium]
MTYAFPAYLYALPAMAIPVILYLLFRRKRRDVPWGAIYILRKVIETRSKTTAWLQYLIIALRLLALAALVLVFAAPHQAWTPPTDGSFPEAPRATHRLILLDTSASMTARVEGGTALDRALSLSRRLIASCVAPGQVDLLPLDGRDKTIVFNQLPVSESNLEEVIAECTPTDGSAQVRRGLQKALDLFRASPWQRRELYLLSDFRAADFGEGQEGELARILKALAEMEVTVHAVRFASTETSNFALRSMAPAVDTLLANQPSLFRIEVGAYPTGANSDE